MSRDKHRVALAGVLVALGAVLLITAPRGTFSIDESSYIATITGLKDGALAVEASAKLAPSPELYGFDAAPRGRPIVVPVASSSPPLYAPLALPFSFFGIRGLMALQILAFLACAALIFSFVRRITKRADLAWLALGTFVVGSFTLEYAQAIWPHAASMALTMGALVLTSHVRGGGSPWLAAGAGACVALAAGLRYQNVVLLATVGAGLLWVPRAQLRAAILAFVVGAAPFVLASSAMNHVRYESWNPISKGGAYLEIAGGRAEKADIFLEVFGSTWSRVVDYSTWPAASPGMRKDERTGAHTLVERTKKALLQSSPWAIIPLLAMLLAVRRRKADADDDVSWRRELLASGVVVGGTIGMFAIYGARRYDGWSFNQRYLLELMPLLACGLALALARMKISSRGLGIGVLVGLTIGLAILRVDFTTTWRPLALMKVPLLLAIAACATWFLSSHNRIRPAAFAAVLGIALGWAAAMQLGEDLPGSRDFRTENARRLRVVESALPDEPAVLFAYAEQKDALGPLLLDRDLLVVDPWIDDGKTARRVIESAFAAGRRVFVVTPIPREILLPMVANLSGRRAPGTSNLLELAP